jgi:hypothetical protein
MQPLLKHCL